MESKLRAIVYYPLPLSYATGGLRVLTSHHAALRAAGVEQDIVCPSNKEPPLGYATALFDRVWEVSLEVAHPVFRPAGAALMQSDTNSNIPKWASYQTWATFIDLAWRGQYDVAIIHWHHNWRLATYLPPQMPKAIVVHDIISHAHKTMIDAGIKPEFPLGYAEEIGWLGHYDLVITMGEEDRAKLAEDIDIPVVAAPPTFEILECSLGGASPRQHFLTISSRTRAHTAGVLWCAKEVWPRIKAALPGAAWRIVGNVCQDVRPGPGIELCGALADYYLDDCYWWSDIVLNPCIAGKGVKIKTLEALARGKPVVGGPLAWSNIAGGDLIADSRLDKIVAKAICYAINAEAYDDAARRGYDVIRQDHSQDNLRAFAAAVAALRREAT